MSKFDKKQDISLVNEKFAGESIVAQVLGEGDLAREFEAHWAARKKALELDVLRGVLIKRTKVNLPDRRYRETLSPFDYIPNRLTSDTLIVLSPECQLVFLDAVGKIYGWQLEAKKLGPPPKITEGNGRVIAVADFGSTLANLEQFGRVLNDMQICKGISKFAESASSTAIAQVSWQVLSFSDQRNSQNKNNNPVSGALLNSLLYDPELLGMLGKDVVLKSFIEVLKSHLPNGHIPVLKAIPTEEKNALTSIPDSRLAFGGGLHYFFPDVLIPESPFLFPSLLSEEESKPPLDE